MSGTDGELSGTEPSESGIILDERVLWSAVYTRLQGNTPKVN